MSERDPVRKSYHHQRVLWDGGIISARAAFCHEFGENPDVDYNTAAKAQECNHTTLRYHDNGERGWYVCDECDLSDPDWRKKFTACHACSWRRDPKCVHCHGLGLVPKGA